MRPAFFLLSFLLACLSFCAVLHQVSATYGVDLSYFQGDVSLDSLKCLKNQGAQFIIVEATKGSSGAVNPYVASVISKAKQAGFQYVDAYMFLNFRRGEPAVQVREVMDFLNQHGVLGHVGMFWHDVEAAAYWGTCAQNQQFLREALAEGQKYGHVQAIYSSASQWSPIMCGTTAFSGYQLWYAHYDGKPSFSDFSPFGGWTHPSIKQYQGTTNVCGTSVDLNFY